MTIHIPSPHRLRPGLPGYLIRFAPLAFVPHRRTRVRRAPSHGWSSRDYRISLLPLKYPLPLPVPSLAVYPKFVKLGSTIYPGIYQTGYGRFRPNKSGHHLSCGYYRGGWHPSYPALTPQAFYAQEQPTLSVGTWSPLVAVACIAKVSRLLRPVGPGLVSQSPSPGSPSQGPYPS